VSHAPVQALKAAGASQWWRRTAPLQSAVQQPARPADLDSRVPFRMMMGFTFVMLLAPQLAFPVLAPLRIAMLVSAGSVLTYMYCCVARGKPFLEWKPGIKLALVLAGWAVATVPLSYWPGGSVAMLLGEYFKTLLVFLLLAHIVDSADKLRTLSLGLVLMALPLAGTALLAFVTGGSQMSGERALVIYNSPLTANPNDMALMLNLILPFAIGLFLSSAGKTLLRLLLGAAICILVATIIVTFSRAGFLALTLTFMVYMWRLRRRPERAWIPAALVLMVLALPFVPASYYDRLSTITDIEADASGSAQTRWQDAQVAVELIINNPVVGAGAGMNIFAMNEARGETSLEIHNVYLQYGVDLGLPGLFVFLLLFASCIRSAQAVCDRAAYLPDPDGLFYLAEAIKVSLLAFAVEAAFHPVAYNFYFYYIAGLAVALRTICDREEGLS
jgi:probable O-glycosylation ligase (exosortase A-associated)